MGCIAIIRFFLIGSFFLISHIVNADEDIEFIYSMCYQGMKSQTSIPAIEIDKFCRCASNEVRKKISQQQRVSIREAKSILRAKKPFPLDLFQKTGLKSLVAKSQDYCTDLLYPVEPEITEKEHEKYSLLANKSVDEFNALLDIRCDKYPKSIERERCLVKASREWLQTKGKKYEGIPPTYISGNDLAKIFIERLRK